MHEERFPICDPPWVRAQLVTYLIHQGRFQQAEEGALALVGTPYQAWFMHARAWHQWSLGYRSEAARLLDLSMDIQGSTALSFQLVDGKPRLPDQFTNVPLPFTPSPLSAVERQLLLWVDDPTVTRRLTKAGVEKLFSRLRPVLASCVVPRERLSPTSSPGHWSGAAWCEFMDDCINDANRLREVVDQLRELYQAHPPTLAISASYAYYLMLDNRCGQALEVLEQDLAGPPKDRVLASLRVVALYRTSRRYQALEAAGKLILDGREGPIMLILGMLALEEGQRHVARRYLYEALTSPPDFLFALALLHVHPD